MDLDSAVDGQYSCPELVDLDSAVDGQYSCPELVDLDSAVDGQYSCPQLVDLDSAVDGQYSCPELWPLVCTQFSIPYFGPHRKHPKILLNYFPYSTNTWGTRWSSWLMHYASTR